MENPLCPPSDPNFRLIETFGYAPGQGCAHLKLHLARMARSARAFGIGFDAHRARALADAVQDTDALRCRMTLDAGGQVELATSAMAPATTPWKLGIAEAKLDSTNPWLRHKTTQRLIYDTARANMPEGIDELIFLNERGEICEGTITNIFVHLSDGTKVTPPVSCGVLPGVLRQLELDRGTLEERVVGLEELRQARQINVGNSLRGMIAAELI